LSPRARQLADVSERLDIGNALRAPRRSTFNRDSSLTRTGIHAINRSYFVARSSTAVELGAKKLSVFGGRMEAKLEKGSGLEPAPLSQVPRITPAPATLLVRIMRGVDQQRIVLAIAVVLFVLFAIFLDGFVDPGNILTLLQGVAVIGVLGLGMAIAIIGRGIDLSMIAVLVMPTAWMFVEVDWRGWPHFCRAHGWACRRSSFSSESLRF
jgi:hypothetical protein